MNDFSLKSAQKTFQDPVTYYEYYCNEKMKQIQNITEELRKTIFLQRTLHSSFYPVDYHLLAKDYTVLLGDLKYLEGRVAVYKDALSLLESIRLHKEYVIDNQRFIKVWVEVHTKMKCSISHRKKLNLFFSRWLNSGDSIFTPINEYYVYSCDLENPPKKILQKKLPAY